MAASAGLGVSIAVARDEKHSSGRHFRSCDAGETGEKLGDFSGFPNDLPKLILGKIWVREWARFVQVIVLQKSLDILNPSPALLSRYKMAA